MSKTRLASNRSARWALMERFEIPDYDHPERNYLTRWRLVQTPLFGVYLHRFDGPDPRTTLHDHPWPFVSIVLRGGYIERRLDPETLIVHEHHQVRRVNRARSGAAHAITSLLRLPTWTLMLVGRRSRKWGYLEPAGGLAVNWIPDGEGGTKPSGDHASWGDRWLWTAFDKHPHATEFDRALLDRAELADRGQR